MSMFCPGSAPRRRRWALSTKTLCLLVAGVVFSSASPILAQSAADKATARQLATQGIQSYQQGKNAEALDLLQKAQQLYDAPVHLIYIARAQAALGKLVDASETYRRLIRIDLPAGAPQAFKDAVSDAHKELPQLEPRIPHLRIDVNPSDAPGLKLKLDGELLSSVVIGINRPTNPGKHTIEVSANGFEPASATVDLAQGGKQTVTLRMIAKPGVVPGSESTEPASATLVPANTQSKDGSGSTPGRSSAGIGPTNAGEAPVDRRSQIAIGVRGVLAAANGDLALGNDEAPSRQINGSANDMGIKERFPFGGGINLDVGYRFSLSDIFRLTPKVGFEYLWWKAGNFYKLPIQRVMPGYAIPNVGTNSTVLSDVQPQGHMVLLGAMVELAPGKDARSLSYYAHAMLAPQNEIRVSGSITSGNSTCRFSDSYKGFGFGAGLGVWVPLVETVRISAGVNLSAYSMRARTYSDNCPRTDGSEGISATITSFSTNAVYSISELVLGGEYSIGI